MKKILLGVFLLFQITITDAQDNKPFCINCEIGDQTIIADVWIVPTGFIKGNQILGQFSRIDKRPLEDVAIPEKDIDEFIVHHGKNYIRIGQGSYFVSYENKKFSIISVERDSETHYTKKRLPWTALIPELKGDFMNLFVSKKQSLTAL